jgi:hypothetical protein
MYLWNIAYLGGDERRHHVCCEICVWVMVSLSQRSLKSGSPIPNASRERLAARAFRDGSHEHYIQHLHTLTTSILISTTQHIMAPIQRLAASSLRAATRPALAFRTPALVRYEGTEQPRSSPAESPKERMGDSGMIRQEDAAEGQPDHSPKYSAAVDYRTS